MGTARQHIELPYAFKKVTCVKYSIYTNSLQSFMSNIKCKINNLLLLVMTILLEQKNNALSNIFPTYQVASLKHLESYLELMKHPTRVNHKNLIVQSQQGERQINHYMIVHLVRLMVTQNLVPHS